MFGPLVLLSNKKITAVNVAEGRKDSIYWQHVTSLLWFGRADNDSVNRRE